MPTAKSAEDYKAATFGFAAETDTGEAFLAFKEKKEKETGLVLTTSQVVMLLLKACGEVK